MDIDTALCTKKTMCVTVRKSISTGENNILIEASDRSGLAIALIGIENSENMANALIMCQAFNAHIDAINASA